jgi:hypothetical protein
MSISLISCNKCGPFPDKFKTLGLEWNIYGAVYSDTAANKLSLSEIVNDTVAYNLYAIRIKPETEYYFTVNQNYNSFELINSVFACDPALPTTDERIDSIIIITDKDFDSNYPAVTDLSDLFDIVVIDETNYTVQEKFKLNSYLETKPTMPRYMTLILNSPPNLTTDFEFTVKYYQDGIDHNFFEFKTYKVVIINE